MTILCDKCELDIVELDCICTCDLRGSKYRDNKLRRVKINGTTRSIDALRDFSEQFDRVASECDSAAHEVAASAMRWAAERIIVLEGRLARIERELKS